MNRASFVKRIPYIQKCIVRSPGSELTGVLCNLSVAGAYVGMEPIPNVGDIVSVEFLLPGNDVAVVVDAQFIWRNAMRKSPIHSLPVGGGARFFGLGVNERRRLEEAIRSYTPPIR